MPKPAYPVSGEVVATDWGKQLIDWTKEKGIFVRNVGGWQLENVDGIPGGALLECTQIPANDPRIFAVEASMLIRGPNANDNVLGQLLDYNPDTLNGGPLRISKYSSGTLQRGGTSGSAPVWVGGVNNRQIVWTASNPGSGKSKFWVRVWGYWMHPEPPAYPIENDPIIAGWGIKEQDASGVCWEFVPLYTNVLQDVQGSPTNNTPVPVSLDALLPPDPDIVAVAIQGRILDTSGGDNITVTVLDGGSTTDQAMTIYSSGVQSRGGGAGPFVALLGGTDGRSLGWYSSVAGTACRIWVQTVGYWKRRTIPMLAPPTYPVPGEPISSAWARDTIDMTAKRLAYGKVAGNGRLVNGADGSTTTIETPVPNIPAGAVYALAQPFLRDNNGTEDLAMTLLHADDTIAGYAYAEGVSQRGGQQGPYLVKMTAGGGIRWKTNQAGTGVDVYLDVVGFAWDGEAIA